MTESARADEYTGQTEGDTPVRSPWRDFLRTETGSAAVLLAGVVAALVWANIGFASYETVWHTDLSVRLGGMSVSLDLRDWVNSGLMAFFFFVVGLEARREFDMGELRDRRRVALPVLAGACGLCVPVLIYVLINLGHGTERGWGAAMSTDTAFALGLLALLGRRLPTALRTFVLSVAVVDDFVALAVIAFAYSSDVRPVPLLVAVGLLVAILVIRSVGLHRGAVYAVLAIAVWVALLKSGIDPVVTGLVMGLLTVAYPSARSDLERASGLFRRFREQPTPELERTVRRGLASAISPNERLQRTFHPWTSYAIVPVFALANAGIRISPDELARAYTSPVTLGIMAGLVLGKPTAVLGSTLLASGITRGRVRPPVGWGAVTAGGTVAGVGFTVSLLIATLAFHGDRLAEAKTGILSAMIVAFALTWTVAWVIGRMPKPLRGRALLGTSDPIIDLAVPVDPERDKVRGPMDAPVTVVEYGDFECPYCGLAESAIRDLLADFGDVRYVWRHLPLNDVHAQAQLAAEASEAAAEQDRFWEMHDVLLVHQGQLRLVDLLGYAEEIGLDIERFRRFLRRHSGAARISEDVDSADQSGVSGTPTFFINGRRHRGAYDIDHLAAAVRTARVRVALNTD